MSASAYLETLRLHPLVHRSNPGRYEHGRPRHRGRGSSECSFGRANFGATFLEARFAKNLCDQKLSHDAPTSYFAKDPMKLAPRRAVMLVVS